jgi:hypothetical protein
MMLVLTNWYTTSVVKLHPMSLPLVPRQKHEVFCVPCPAPPGATVLRSHWNYSIKPCGTRKARMCCDGSERTAPELDIASPKRMPRASISHA